MSKEFRRRLEGKKVAKARGRIRMRGVGGGTPGPQSTRVGGGDFSGGPFDIPPFLYKFCDFLGFEKGLFFNRVWKIIREISEKG